MREFYGMDSKATGRAKERAEEYAMAKQLKKKHCECTGQTEVFAKPPCDVFRAENRARKKRIEHEWDQHRKRYIDNYGQPLFDKSHFLNLMIDCHPPVEQAKIRGARKMRKQDRKLDEWGKLWDHYNVEAERVERINHLVPKEAGGCPTNPNNLQPQQLLCLHCQAIDQMMTDHWQG